MFSLAVYWSETDLSGIEPIRSVWGGLRSVSDCETSSFSCCSFREYVNLTEDTTEAGPKRTEKGRTGRSNEP